MKFMSSAAVFIVIAAFAACAAGAGSADDEQPGDSLQLRLRRSCTTFCGPRGCCLTCNGQRTCDHRMKREDLAALDAAVDVNEDAAPVGDNAESTEDEQPGDSLRLRLRRGCATSCSAHGCTTTCTRMKREDLATLDAALDGSEDGDSLRLRLRRGCATSCGPFGCTTTCTRMKREDLAAMDAALDVDEDGDSLRLRLRRGCATSCSAHGCTTTCTRMKREDLAAMDAALGVNEANGDAMPIRTRRSQWPLPINCQHQSTSHLC